MICIHFCCLLSFWHRARDWNIFYVLMPFFRCCRKNNVVVQEIHLRKETTLGFVLLENTSKHCRRDHAKRGWNMWTSSIFVLFSSQQKRTQKLELCEVAERFIEAGNFYWIKLKASLLLDLIVKWNRCEGTYRRYVGSWKGGCGGWGEGVKLYFLFSLLF